jgi:hypothetical protein
MSEKQPALRGTIRFAALAQIPAEAWVTGLGSIQPTSQEKTMARHQTHRAVITGLENWTI